MAQDVAEKIRAAAVAKGIDPDTALRIAGVESSYDPKAKNPRSSAQGLFQVIDDTWKRYGGKPGKQRDTDENIRVGMLILEDNTNKLSKILGRAPRPSELYTAHFFGSGTGAEVLRASPDTPINRIASKKVMAANPELKGLTVGQLMAKHEAKFARTPGTPAYVGKKGGERQDDTQQMMTDALSSGQTAQAPTVLDDPRIKALGTNYQMALAATALADKDDDREDDGTTEAERFQQYTEERQAQAAQDQEPGPARKALASFDISYKSPFVEDAPAEQAPIQMALGGMANAPPSTGIRQSEKAAIESANAEWEKYKAGIEKYNADADAYNEMVKKAKADADAWMAGYEKAGERPKNPKTKKFYALSFGDLGKNARQNKYATDNPYTAPNLTAPVQPNAPTVQPQELLALAQKKANNRNLAISAFFNPEQYNLSFSEGGEVEEPYTPGKVAKMGEDNSKKNLQEFLPPSKMSVQALDNLLISAGVDVSKVGRGQKLDLAKALYAQANGQVGNASLYARMSNEGNRPEMLGGMSLPMGNGRASVDVNPGGVNYGYQTRLGSGEIMANFFKPMQGPGQGSVQYRMPLGRADGGAVHRANGSPEGGERLTPQQIERLAEDQLALNTYQPTRARPSTGMNRQRGPISDALDSGAAYVNMAKGVTELPYDLVGAPMDISNFFMTPFGKNVEKPVMGSDFLKEQATKAGIRPLPPTDPTLKGFFNVGELGANLTNPAGVARKTVQGAETVAKGAKKAKDMLGELKKSKEVPQTAAAPAPEVQTELAQLHQNRQYPRAPGQEPDPWMGVAPTVAEAEANVAARQAQPLPPPPAEVAVPPALLETPLVAPPMQATASPVQAGVSAERPFVGRLDSFIDTLKGPVQLGQLKGQLKGKFRDYDLERVERAFPGIDAKTKLTPDQIKQALAGTHSPQKWISETVAPKEGAHFQNMDNVWGAPLGTTNLYLEQTPEALAANDLLKKAAQVFNPFMKKSTSSVPTAESLEKARVLLTDPELMKVVDPELVENLSKTFDKVEKNVGLVNEYATVIKNVSDGFQYPILYKDATVASAKYLNQPFFKFKEEAMDAEREAIRQRLLAGGSDEKAARSFASHQININFNTYDQNASKIASQKVQELAIAEAQKHGINLPDVSLVKWDELNDVTRPMEGNTAFKESLENALEPSRVTVHEATKNIKNVLDPEIKKVGDILYKQGNLYEGKHPTVAKKPYPIGFTRFSEHETTIEGLGTVQGRHFHELQSDLSKDMRKSGTTSGNATKDQAEYNKLEAQINKHRDDTFAQVQALQQEHKNGTLDYASYMEKQKKAREALENKINPLEHRISVLGSRTRSNAPYSLQEPFAGFETNQMVRQQLLMKNAIQASIRDGKSFATFPGAESAQPTLYEKKVLPNLKQVAKDLGGEKAGFDVRQIQLPPDKDGNPITAWGMTWSPETAARIVEKGIPFAKGGMVERQSADTRRYL